MAKESDGPACWLELSCGRLDAAAAITHYLGLADGPSTASVVIGALLNKFRLVPHHIERLEPNGDPVPVDVENERLRALHGYLDVELREILLEAGHSAGPEASNV